MKFDGYIRVSATKGRKGPSFISPEVQRDTIMRLAKTKGIKVGQIVQELDVSGGKRIQDRELGRLVQRIEDGQSAGLIVWKVSRFSRNLLDAVEATTRITNAGGRLIAEDFDSQQAMSKAMLGFLAGFAEEELDARRQGWDEAHRRAIERGVGNGMAPIGYRRGPDGRFIIDKAEARQVRQAFRMRAAGAPLSKIARQIGRSHVTVHNMVGNVAYIGTVKYGQYVKQGAHEAIVDRTLFDAANAARTTRSVPAGKTTGDRLLQGIARCSGCGNTLKVVHRKKKDGPVAAYYCKNQAKDPCADRAFVDAEPLDLFVEQWFEGALKTVPRVVDVVETNRELEEAQTEQAEAEAQLVAYVKNASALDGNLFQLGIESRQRRVDQAHELVASLASRAAKLPSGGKFIDLWDGFDRAQRHDVLVGFLDGIMVNRGASKDLVGSIRITWSDGTVADHESAVRMLAA
jgi:site-specific DNA recombinase